MDLMAQKDQKSENCNILDFQSIWSIWFILAKYKIYNFTGLLGAPAKSPKSTVEMWTDVPWCYFILDG